MAYNKKNKNGGAHQGMVGNDNSKHANLPTEAFTKAYRKVSYNSDMIGDELKNVYEQMDADAAKARKDMKLKKV